jgi:spore coat polysaccharide biosynthesis protein SpsF (cytidylyltransferase family)
MKFCIILQARLGSTRLPNKILKYIYKKETILSFLIKRIKKEKFNLIVATTKNKKDNKIIRICKKLNIRYFRGPENNVYKRFYDCSNKYKIQNIIRLTSDCPLVDIKLLKKMITVYNKKNLEYFSNTLPIKKSRFPNGSDIEIFKSELFSKFTVLNSDQKQHVTNLFWKDKKIKSDIFLIKKNYSNLRYTLDYKEDLLVIKKIISYLKKSKKDITYKNICNFLLKNKKIMKVNNKYNQFFQGKKIKV